MKLHYHGFRAEAGTPVREALTAVRYHGAAAPGPILLGYTPVARVNPYQSLLYREFRTRGFAVAPVTDPLSFGELNAVRDQAAAVVCHLHWPSFVLRDAAGAAEADRLRRDFTARLDAFIEGGGRLLWTVHNLVSHDARFLEAELALQQDIADRAWRIHVMDGSTLESAADYVRLDPERVIVAPHPSYLGAYEDYVTREEARTTLEIDADETVYVAFGAIKAYKGLERFVDGFDAALAAGGPARRLIVAGAPDADPATEKLLRRLREHPYVLLEDRKVPGDRVQFLMRAADVAVVPHERALNSGAALLGPTFGLPVLASRVGVLPSLLGEGFAEFFDGAGDVAAAIRRADRLVAAGPREAAAEFARRHAPSTVSAAFADQLRSALGI